MVFCYNGLDRLRQYQCEISGHRLKKKIQKPSGKKKQVLRKGRSQNIIRTLYNNIASQITVEKAFKMLRRDDYIQEAIKYEEE